MSFLTLQERLCGYLGEYVTDNESLDHYKFLLNNAMQTVAAELSWSFMRRRGSLRTMAPYSTGDVTVTSGSKSVAPGGGATFTWEMVGGLIRFEDGIDEAYEIEGFDGTNLILKVPYPHATLTNEEYEIVKSKYVLPLHIAHVHHAWMRDGDQPIYGTHGMMADVLWPDEESQGQPTEMRIVGHTNAALYSTGTVSVTEGSATVTSSGAAFDDEFVGMTFRVQGELKDYLITAVNETTDELTISPAYQGDDASGQSYDIQPAGSPEIQFEDFKVGDEYMIEYIFTLHHPWLEGDTEMPLFPPALYPLIYESAYLKILSQENAGVDRLMATQRTIDSLMAQARNQHEVIYPRFVSSPSLRMQRMGTGGGGLHGINPGMLAGGNWGW